MNHSRISIIIPAFNEEKNLPACLDSIVKVDYPEELMEIIVVDNGSTDRTRAIAHQYNVKLFRDDSKNVSGLRNLGVATSTGTIIAFIDADCVASQDWLTNAAVYFDDPKIAAWGAPPAVPANGTWVQKTWHVVRSKGNNVAEVDWLESMNLFVRKKQFLEIGGFNESLMTCEDVDLSYRLKKFGKILSDSTIQVVHHGEAATMRQFIQKEVWRGIGNIRGIFSHGVTLNELPSLMIPVYFGIFIPLFFLSSLITRNLMWLTVLLVACLAPTLLALMKIFSRTKPSLTVMMNLSFLLQLYFFSRAYAIFKRTYWKRKNDSCRDDS